MKNTFDNHPRKQRWLAVVPFVALAAVFMLELETPGLRVTPSLLMIFLAMFAVFLSPRSVFLWAAFMFIPVVLTLIFIPNNGNYETPMFVGLRSASYVAVGYVAVLLSRYREDAERRFEVLMDLFNALKTPLVVSDINGNINFANRACCELLERDAKEIKDTNFFSVFSQADQRGQSIERYLKFFDMQLGQSSSMAVSVQKKAMEETQSANCFVIQLDKQKLLVTQLN